MGQGRRAIPASWDALTVALETVPRPVFGKEEKRPEPNKGLGFFVARSSGHSGIYPDAFCREPGHERKSTGSGFSR